MLNNDEIRKFKELHNKILISTTPITSTTGITSTNKQSLGVNTEIYDWNQNSMGQDNIAKIILALFSFQRLKDKYGPLYQGGILAIDELDATMYPASQVELLKVLRKYASDLKLQIFFTTHSLSLLEATDELCKETKSHPETSNQIRIIYLKHSDDQVLIKSDVDFNGIALDLNVIAETPHKRKNKITVYVEDKETEIFVKAILKQKLYGYLNFVDATFSCSSLIELVNKKVPAFSYPYSIIFLDGDVRKDKANKKKLSVVRNVLLLPGDDSPERLVAKYLYNLSDTDPLWNNISNGYTKQVCFREFSFDRILADREDAKKWFNQQLQYWGRVGVKVLNPFFNTIQEEVDKFKYDYSQMIKRYIHD